jgi:hypothetical protein
LERLKDLLAPRPQPRRGRRLVRTEATRASGRTGPRASQVDWREALAAERSGARAAPVEQPCPSCGEPMLASWGTTCGRCKPRLASPKTIMLATPDDLVGSLSMTLGWLVVRKTPDAAQRGALVDLVDPVLVLSRAGAGPTAEAGARQLEFADDFMSAGHAVLRRPPGLAPDEAFTLEDRKVPGPSANGTFVNGRKLTLGEAATLHDGDIVRVGTTELYFKSLWLPPAQAIRAA